MTTISTHSDSLVASSPRQSTLRATWVAVFRAGMSLIRRDVLLLVRRPSRIVATVLTPALLWAFFAGGFGEAVASSSGAAAEAYTVSLAAGAALLVVTFASIFGSLGLIRDRESGCLQAVLVGPTPRWAVLGARVASGTLFAFLQASTMLLAAIVLTNTVSFADLALASLMLVLAATGLSGCCSALAWRFKSIEGFHGIMAAVLLPGWLLSGAVFPPGAGTGVMDVIMQLNPLAYAHGAIAGSLGATPLFATNVFATITFGVLGFGLATTTTRGDAKR